MNHFATIFRKEFTDTIRDRRTLFFSVLFPLLLVPLLLTVVAKLQTSSMKKAEDRIIRVGLVTNGGAIDFAEDLVRDRGLRVIQGIPADSAEAFIKSDSLDAFIVVARDFDTEVKGMRAGTISLYYKSSEDYGMVRQRLVASLGRFEKSLTSARFKKLNLDESIVNTIRVEEHDVASTKERIGKAIGGMVPYFFVIFCFLGAMYPAIDLAAGEKERGTMETLLTAPVSRFQILLGKFAVVVLTGVLSAVVSMLGLYVAVQVALQQVKGIPPDFMRAIMGILDVQTILLILSLLLPLAVFFAAVLLSLSIFAKSYKEAQGLISPLSIVIILPVLVGVMPGVELDAVTAIVPVLNVSLATREIISGTIKPLLLAEVYVALLALASVSLWGCAKWFEREETIFRGA
jgi:sodium transport system permease protein